MDSATMKSPQSGSGLAQLAARLTKRLAEENPSTNLVFSPLSIYTALSLLAAGARDATLGEILHVLGAQSRGELENFVSRMAADALQDRYASGGPRVAFACGVWSDLSCPLKPAFREAVVGTYKAEASTVNFRGTPEEARGQINAWAAQVTRNLIDTILPPGPIKPATTRIVLGNAMYFKGMWEDDPFDRSDNVDEPFHRLDHSQVDVPFMRSMDGQFVAVHDGFKVLKLRYKMAAPDGDEDARPAPLGRGDSHRHNHDNVGESDDHGRRAHRPYPPYNRGRRSPKKIPIRHLPYFRHRPYPPPPFRNPISPHAYPSKRAAPSANSGSDHTGYTQFSMCIFLPEAHDGLWGLLDTIASRPGFLHDHLPEQRIDIREFRMPKFKLSFHSSITDVVKKLGLELPFCEQGNLSDMVEDNGSGLPTVVEDVIHKAVVEVNEEGTEAAAVTVLVGRRGCAMPRRPPTPPQVDFIADHPFAYYIMEEVTGALVFAGYVLDPSKK